MTREEAKRETWEVRDILDIDNVQHLVVYQEPLYNFIDKIYDDFENRTCANCNLVGKESCTLNFIRHSIPTGVSCYKWESK